MAVAAQLCPEKSLYVVQYHGASASYTLWQTHFKQTNITSVTAQTFFPLSTLPNRAGKKDPLILCLEPEDIS